MIEWLGNLLPNPVTMFAAFALLVVVASAVAAYFELSVEDPRPVGSKERSPDGVIRAVSLLDADGIRRIVENLVKNFVEFAPLGTVLVALLGVAVAEKSGLLSAVVRLIVLDAPKTMVTAALVFAGVISNTASEIGYVLIVPLGAAIFHSLGRHPLAGLAAAYAGVSGGYSANLLLGTVDPLLAGFTQQAARIIDPEYEVHAAVNLYFMMASVFLITPLGTWITVAIVEPQLGPYNPNQAAEDLQPSISVQRLTRDERRALRWTGLSVVLVAIAITILAGPLFSTLEMISAPTDTDKKLKWRDVVQWSEADLEQARARTEAARQQWLLDHPPAHLGDERLPTQQVKPFEAPTYDIPIKSGWRGVFNQTLLSIPYYGALRNADNGNLLSSPLTRGVVALIFMGFIVPGFVFGWCVGTMRSDRDVIDAMADSMRSMGLYIVLVFFAAQFVSYFNWSKFGEIIAVAGSNLIAAMGMKNDLIFIPFIILCAFINLLMGSASAKWAVTAPIFVPILMRSGYSPELTQCAYRIGDSATNVITPMMSYFGIIYSFACRYDKRLGIGTLISMMMPFSIIFIIAWTIMFYLWVFVLGLPIGPGAPIRTDKYKPQETAQVADGVQSTTALFSPDVDAKKTAAPLLSPSRSHVSHVRIVGLANPFAVESDIGSATCSNSS
ncbi:MAG TPA: AbgT family transporter [Pirellulaceae bacterium]|nr:AbgT family transporter [Pirellulaceae bacterium]